MDKEIFNLIEKEETRQLKEKLTQEAYKDLISKITHTPVTSDLCKSVIALPMHTELDSEQLEYITKHIKHFFKTKA